MRNFDWGLYPEAENHLRSLLADALRRSETARGLAAEIEEGTSTDFFEWVDHLALPRAALDKKRLLAMRFVEGRKGGVRSFRVPGSTLFPLVEAEREELVLGPESLADFCAAHFPNLKITDEGAAYRKAELVSEGGLVMAAAERRGFGGFSGPEPDDVNAYRRALEAFRSRPRSFDAARDGFEHLNAMIEDALVELDSARVADAFFRAEREFWQTRNAAARTQKARQDRLGVGWGNVDHHTFRSSRTNFSSLIGIFGRLGMNPRERYHAGSQAGWGAQILEHPGSGEVVFADVDLAEGERTVNFSKQPLGELRHLGTVGLWVELNGESLFEAGMHHAAARFRFDDLARALERDGLRMMTPFSSFPFLRQAFTAGEVWIGREERIKTLASKKLISPALKKRFLAGGAIGSHLENIERRQGFKGFNQDSVSVVIRATDPRRPSAKGA
jgi:hypothetical protein